MTAPASGRLRAEWLCSLLFSLSALAWMQGPAGAFGFGEYGFPTPAWDYAVLFYRAYFMRHKPTAPGALALGAAADLYTGCPLGVHMLLYYAMSFIVKRISLGHEREEYPSWPKTAFFSLSAAVVGESLFLALLYGARPPAEALLVRTALTLAAYPPVHLLMRGFAASGGDGGPAPDEAAHKPPVRALHYIPEENHPFAP